MPIDKQLLEILVCPQCKGAIVAAGDGSQLLCNRCKIKYPVRDGIPIMVVEEALDSGGAQRSSGKDSVKLPKISFKVTEGADINMTFQVEQSTCRAIGRTETDLNKTSIFNVDVALALDGGTRGLILKYIGRQFKETGKARSSGVEGLGRFRRAPDVILTDTGLSRLHAMIFADRSGVAILDLVSKNGTYVNGQEVESKMLSRGDVIEMGETRIVFEG